MIDPSAMVLPVCADVSEVYCDFAESDVDHWATIIVTLRESLPVEYVNVYSSKGDADVHVALGEASVRA